MKLKELTQLLDQLDGFETPNITLEQYQTPTSVATTFLFEVLEHEDIEGKAILDLGCGPGTLGIGAKLLGAGSVTSLDVDPSAIAIAQSNCEDLEIDIDFIQANAFQALPQLFLHHPIYSWLLSTEVEPTPLPAGTDLTTEAGLLPFDTVIMNPPFGTRTAGADLFFLRVASMLCSGAVYSLHKSSTRKFLVQEVERWGLEAKVLGQFEYPLAKSYSFHKKESEDIQVDLLRVNCRSRLPTLKSLVAGISRCIPTSTEPPAPPTSKKEEEETEEEEKEAEEEEEEEVEEGKESTVPTSSHASAAGSISLTSLPPDVRALFDQLRSSLFIPHLQAVATLQSDESSKGKKGKKGKKKTLPPKTFGRKSRR